jgi:paraquat-inducible protein B
MSLWIKNRYRDLKNFSNKTLVKMKKVFGLISKFALENEDRIIEGAKTGEAVVTIRNWYPELLDIDKLEKELDSLKFSDEFESIMNDTQKFVDDHFKSNDLVEVKITQKMAKIAIKNAINSDKVDSLIKKYVKEAEEALRKTEEASKEGLKNTKDEQKVIESKEQVDESKKDILKTSKKCSILINLINKAVIDSHKINVACASMYTGNNN